MQHFVHFPHILLTFLIRVAIFLFIYCSYMVLQKDVREFDSSCPPKADASLKPGEFEVGATEVVRSRAYLLSAVCGPLCTLTHLAENTRRVEDQRSFVYVLERTQRWRAPVTLQSIFKVLTKLFFIKVLHYFSFYSNFLPPLSSYSRNCT